MKEAIVSLILYTTCFTGYIAAFASGRAREGVYSSCTAVVV